MSLEDKLSQLREASKGRIPEDKRAIMGAATQALRDSGILEKAAKVGDQLPSFSLNNANGETVSSADLLAKGPVVVTIFRGHW